MSYSFQSRQTSVDGFDSLTEMTYIDSPAQILHFVLDMSSPRLIVPAIRSIASASTCFWVRAPIGRTPPQ